MSEPDNAEIGRSIGDNKEDNIEDDAVACCAATGTARRPDFAQHQGQVGHRGRQIHLESRLDPTEVTGLPDAQLDQPRQPVFCHHPALSVLVVVGALLRSPCLLQEGLLRWICTLRPLLPWAAAGTPHRSPHQIGRPAIDRPLAARAQVGWQRQFNRIARLSDHPLTGLDGNGLADQPLRHRP